MQHYADHKHSHTQYPKPNESNGMEWQKKRIMLNCQTRRNWDNLWKGTSIYAQTE